MQPKPKVDPELKRQQQAAANEKISTIQDTLSSDTNQSLRYFGAQQAMAGTKTSPLLSLLR
jgi:hypothetical protein